MAIIDMKAMRCINLLDKVSRVKTKKCFTHNNTIFFAVKKREISKAIGSNAGNIKKMQEKIGKKIKIIMEANGPSDIKRFIEDIVAPVKIRAIDIKDNVVIISAGNNQTRASLIGRDKRRYEELKKIIMDTYRMDLKII
jgi:transcription antitermination factor NusA-like protein